MANGRLCPTRNLANNTSGFVTYDRTKNINREHQYWLTCDMNRYFSRFTIFYRGAQVGHVYLSELPDTSHIKMHANCLISQTVKR